MQKGVEPCLGGEGIEGGGRPRAASGMRHPHGRLARRAGRAASSTSRISSSRPLQCRARSQPAARAAAARWPSGPLERAHAQIVAQAAHPGKPIAPRITSSMIAAREGRRPLGVQRGVEHMRGHRERRVGQAAKRRPVARGQQPARGVDHRQARWLSTRARPCPGRCLITGSTPPCKEARDRCLAERADDLGIGVPGAIADRRRAFRQRQVEHRRAVDGDAEGGEIVRDQARQQEGGLAARRRVPFGELADPSRRRSGRPMRRAAAARVRPPGRSGPAHRGGPTAARRAPISCRSLLGAAAVALEQDEARGRPSLETGAARPPPGAGPRRRRRRHGRRSPRQGATTKQLALRRCSSTHGRSAVCSLANGPSWMR